MEKTQGKPTQCFNQQEAAETDQGRHRTPLPERAGPILATHGWSRSRKVSRCAVLIPG